MVVKLRHHPIACGFVDDAYGTGLLGRFAPSAVDNTCGRTAPPTGCPPHQPFAHMLHRLLPPI